MSTRGTCQDGSCSCTGVRVQRNKGTVSEWEVSPSPNLLLYIPFYTCDKSLEREGGILISVGLGS